MGHLSRTEPSLTLEATPALFLRSQVRKSAVQKALCPKVSSVIHHVETIEESSRRRVDAALPSNVAVWNEYKHFSLQMWSDVVGALCFKRTLILEALLTGRNVHSIQNVLT